MAVLERCNYHPMSLEVEDSSDLPWIEDKLARSIPNCPHIFFYDGEPWLAANTYALELFQQGKCAETVVSAMNHLRDYAEWLEAERLDWRYFPLRKYDRCLYRYRGNLIQRREEGELSPSTVSARMSAIVRFYRWAKENNLIGVQNHWKDRQTEIRVSTFVGLKRTLEITSSDLAIPNRRRPGATLEDGLLPISESSRKTLLSYLKSKGMIEIYLMFLIGFFTGARIETIRTMRLSSLKTAINDPSIQNLMRIPVGPPTRIKTKYDVSGSIPFPSALIEVLLRYATSARRLVRQSRASNENKTILFITSNGSKYEENSFTSIISKLRKKLEADGYGEFRTLKFHQSRATFGTQLMRLCLKTTESAESSIVFVRDAMLHKDEATTWKYIKFIENEPLKEKLSNEFFSFFSGNAENPDSLIEEITYESTAWLEN